MNASQKVQVHENDHIRVQYDPNVCEHAAECVRGLSKVFNPEQRPWIQIENADAKAIAEVIHRCPTGALSYEFKGEDVSAGTIETTGPVEVSVVQNGPLRLLGNVVVKDAEGEVLIEASKMSLCRCGHSNNKPFCDGSHKTQGWTE